MASEMRRGSWGSFRSSRAARRRRGPACRRQTAVTPHVRPTHQDTGCTWHCTLCKHAAVWIHRSVVSTRGGGACLRITQAASEFCPSCGSSCNPGLVHNAIVGTGGCRRWAQTHGPEHRMEQVNGTHSLCQPSSHPTTSSHRAISTAEPKLQGQLISDLHVKLPPNLLSVEAFHVQLSQHCRGSSGGATGCCRARRVLEQGLHIREP